MIMPTAPKEPLLPAKPAFPTFYETINNLLLSFLTNDGGMKIIMYLLKTFILWLLDIIIFFYVLVLGRKYKIILQEDV